MQTKQKIMILEDDILTQDVYRLVFSRRNEFDFILCKNDEEFYAALGKNRFDAFLIDLALGAGRDGVQLIKELRQMEEYKLTPIIVVTALAMQKDERVTMDAGATRFLRKPLDVAELLRILTQILKEAGRS